MDVARIAGVVVDVMGQLGYDRFAARGSDLGAGVLQQLALAHPDRLVALHLSGTNPYLGWVPDDLSDAEKAFVTAAEAWNRSEMAYAQEHASKPQTLAHALNDSPVGLASWVLEKFRASSDCGGDLDAVSDRADLLTNLTIYWGTQTIGSSMRLYYETAHSSAAAWGRVDGNGRRTIQARRIAPGGIVGVIRNVSPPTGAQGASPVLAGAAGDAIAAWTSPTGKVVYSIYR